MAGRVRLTIVGGSGPAVDWKGLLIRDFFFSKNYIFVFILYLNRITNHIYELGNHINFYVFGAMATPLLRTKGVLGLG